MDTFRQAKVRQGTEKASKRTYFNSESRCEAHKPVDKAANALTVFLTLSYI